jgi:hypothetical protein
VCDTGYRSDISSCTEDLQWVDSYGDDCVAYEDNPGWCYDAADYADENGDDAWAKCCTCQIALSCGTEPEATGILQCNSTPHFVLALEWNVDRIV